MQILVCLPGQCGDVKFIRISSYSPYPIIIENDSGVFSVTKLGMHIIDYEDNAECTLFPSKEQRDWSKFTAPWYKKEKFDPKTLKPFDKVLVRYGSKTTNYWYAGIFSHYIENDMFPYKCVGNNCKLCIPYNDETKHLVGTTEEAPKYYRYWEDQL